LFSYFDTALPLKEGLREHQTIANGKT